LDPRSAFFVLCMLAGFATVANAFFRDKILSAKDSIIMAVLFATLYGLLAFGPRRNGQIIQLEVILMMATWWSFGKHLKRKLRR